jgi:hypothetical protein
VKSLLLGKSTSVEAMDHALAPAELFKDAIVGNCAAGEGLGICHEAGILGRAREHVNVGVL